MLWDNYSFKVLCEILLDVLCEDLLSLYFAILIPFNHVCPDVTLRIALKDVTLESASTQRLTCWTQDTFHTIWGGGDRSNLSLSD